MLHAINLNFAWLCFAPEVHIPQHTHAGQNKCLFCRNSLISRHSSTVVVPVQVKMDHWRGREKEESSKLVRSHYFSIEKEKERGRERGGGGERGERERGGRERERGKWGCEEVWEKSWPRNETSWWQGTDLWPVYPPGTRPPIWTYLDPYILLEEWTLEQRNQAFY